MEDFVPFEITKKLNEKGFNCEYPFGMYNEDGEFFPLYSSDKYYYDIKDFDEHDYIAPTISQVLKWLREEKEIYISIFIDDDSDNPVTYEIYKNTECVCSHKGEYFTLGDWSKCELKAIEYVLDNLI